jgi:AcrR family transcriptional regulator
MRSRPPPTPPASRRRTRGARIGGRSARVVREVLSAAIAELGRSGFGALRVEDVADRAGVNKTTIYRRWPTKADLIVAAVRAFAGHHDPLPDTGSARGDLIEMVRRVIVFARTAEGRALTRLVASEGGDPNVDRLARTLREGIMVQRSALIARAQERGELPSGLDARLVVDAIFAPVITRVLGRGEDVDPATAVAFVDLVLSGVQHGGGRVQAR